MKDQSRKTETSPLRQKAEELVKKRLSKPGSQLSENEALKLLHKLEVHQIEELLQKSEKRFRNYIESSGDIMYVVDNDLKFLYGNHKYLERRGLTIEELVAKEYRDYHSDEGTGKFMERVKAVHASQKPVVYEYQSEIDGRYFLRTLSPMIDAQTKEIESLTVISRDITERKKAEKELYESRQMLQTVLDTIPAGVFWKDRNFFYLGINRAWLDAVGMKSAEEVIGKSDYDLPWDKEQMDSFREYDKRVMESGIPEFDIIEPFTRADGTLSWARTNKVPLKDREGSIIGILGTYEDVTKIKRANEALRMSEDKYRNLFNNSEVGMFRTRLDGSEILEFNNKYLEIFGYTSEELEGAPSVSIWANKNEREKGVQKLKAEGHVTDLECELLNKQGEVVNCISSARLYPDTGIIEGSIQDITKRKQMESDLTKAHEMLKVLYIYQDEAKENERKAISREIHDELGQLLSVLKIHLSWTKANYENREEVIKKIDSMTDIVNGTIETVQRISSDLRPGLLDDLGLIPAIEWFCQEFENRSGIKCHLNLGDFESSSEKKNLALYRILQEATTNVMRHANARNVYVKCVREEDSIFLEITDDGTGMKQAKIDSSKSLGLIGMRERVKQFNGSLEINSTINIGTKISIYIPID